MKIPQSISSHMPTQRPFSGLPELPTRPPRRLEEQLRDACRVRHYSLRTEEAYWMARPSRRPPSSPPPPWWTRRFVLFHGKRHPRELGGGGDHGIFDRGGDGARSGRQHAARPKTLAFASPVRRRLGRRSGTAGCRWWRGPEAIRQWFAGHRRRFGGGQFGATPNRTRGTACATLREKICGNLRGRGRFWRKLW